MYFFQKKKKNIYIYTHISFTTILSHTKLNITFKNKLYMSFICVYITYSYTYTYLYILIYTYRIICINIVLHMYHIVYVFMYTSMKSF